LPICVTEPRPPETPGRAARAQEKFLSGCAADQVLDLHHLLTTCRFASPSRDLPKPPGARHARKKNFWAAAPPRTRTSTSRSRRHLPTCRTGDAPKPAARPQEIPHPSRPPPHRDAVLHPPVDLPRQDDQVAVAHRERLGADAEIALGAHRQAEDGRAPREVAGLVVVHADRVGETLSLQPRWEAVHNLAVCELDDEHGRKQ
jgi:hypothetical protein